MNQIEEIEIWVDVPGFEGTYQASTSGRVKALAKILKHWRGGDSYFNELILKERKAKNYVSVALYKNLKRKDIDIHRIIAITFIPNPENKPEVNHKDGIKTNNHVSNLEWNTPSENMKHAFKTGLQKSLKGELNNLSKLSNKEVLEIRKMYADDIFFNIKEVSLTFKVTRATIRNIINHKSWVHLLNTN